MKNRKNLIKLILSSICLALSFVFPFITGQVPEIGSMLCPMHIPILLCGFLCGWKWGFVTGFAAPLLRSLILSKPPIFPTAVCMAFELATYGCISGLMYKIFPKKNIYIYFSLFTSMIIGRIVWGISMLTCMGIKESTFSFSAFITGAITNAIPGIILQIVTIPIIVMCLKKIDFFNDREIDQNEHKK